MFIGEGLLKMTPAQQTVFSDPAKGIHGNCFTACVASLFDNPIEDVPNFIDFEEWFKVFWEYVNSQGGEVLGMCYSEPTKEDWELFDGYLIVGGGSPRGIVNGHAVIYKNGQPFFDPHPSGDFLTEVEEYYLIRKPKETP